MKKLERLAIKYLLIGFGIGFLNYLGINSIVYFIDFFDQTDHMIITETISNILRYASNIIVGLFILFDSIKYTKNKLIISVIGFLMPAFGVCFLMIEKYLNLKTTDNG